MVMSVNVTSRRRMIWPATLLVGLLSCAFWAANGSAQRERSDPDSTDPANLKNSPGVLRAFREVVGKARAGTVVVRCEGEDVALGTVVGADGWVLTKASALQGRASCRLGDGRELATRLAGLYRDWDLALLKVDAKVLTPVEWRTGDELAEGSWLAAVGPGEVPVAVGVVSETARAAANWPPPSSWPGGYLGVRLAAEVSQAKVLRVLSGTPAAEAGLRADDVIVEVQGRPVKDGEGLTGHLNRKRPGDAVVLKVMRGGKELELKATLGPRPESRKGGQADEAAPRLPSVIRHDVWLTHNELGGPLVDLGGKVVGVNIAISGRTQNYALTVEAVTPVLKELLAGKWAPSEDDLDLLRSR